MNAHGEKPITTTTVQYGDDNKELLEKIVTLLAGGVPTTAPTTTAGTGATGSTGGSLPTDKKTLWGSVRIVATDSSFETVAEFQNLEELIPLDKVYEMSFTVVQLEDPTAEVGLESQFVAGKKVFTRELEGLTLQRGHALAPFDTSGNGSKVYALRTAPGTTNILEINYTYEV